jgi:ABC-type Fe3+ transport system substrate-binding protein
MNPQNHKNVFRIFFYALLCCAFLTGGVFGADATLLSAKKNAESKGYIFETSHDDVVAKAKKEGRLRVLVALDPRSIKAVGEAFKKKYPLIDIRVEELSGLENYTRMVHEMKAGLAKSWDVNYLAFEHYNDYLPYQKKFDLLGMAQHGILQIAPKLVDPVNRHIVAVQSNIQVIAYNKELIAEEKVPNSWEDFLKPEFKGRKFVVDVRPKTLAALVPAWGLEKVLDFARKIASQQPIWFRGDSRVLTFMLAGDLGLFLGPNYKTFKEVQLKDPKGVLGSKIAAPVPTRLTEAEGVLAAAPNPYAGLLWLEFVCSTEGQKLLDKIDMAASLFTPGSIHEQITKGKTISVMAWEHYTKMGNYEEQIVKAFGFPTAETTLKGGK